MARCEPVERAQVQGGVHQPGSRVGDGLWRRAWPPTGTGAESADLRLQARRLVIDLAYFEDRSLPVQPNSRAQYLGSLMRRRAAGRSEALGGSQAQLQAVRAGGCRRDD